MEGILVRDNRKLSTIMWVLIALMLASSSHQPACADSMR